MNLKRDINFFAVIGQDSSGFAIDFEKVLKICVGIFAIIAIVIIGILTTITTVQKMSINKISEDIAALEEPLARVEQYKIEAENLQIDIDTFNQSVNDFNNQARLTTEDIAKVAACIPNGVVINGFSYSGDTVSLTCTGDSELAIADYANSLRNSQQPNPNPTSEDDLYIKDFLDVSYTGVSRSGDKFNSAISLKLKPPVVEVEEAPEEEAPAEEGESK